MIRRLFTILGVCLLLAVLAAALVAPLLLWGPVLEQSLWIASAFGAMVAILFLASIPKRPVKAAPSQKAAPADLDFDRPWRGRR